MGGARFSGYPLQKSPEIVPSDYPCKATSSSGEDPGEGWDLGHLVKGNCAVFFVVAEGLICNCKISPHLNDMFLNAPEADSRHSDTEEVSVQHSDCSPFFAHCLCLKVSNLGAVYNSSGKDV